jgi:hypothetical protein
LLEDVFHRDGVLDAEDDFSGKRRLTTLVQADDAFSMPMMLFRSERKTKPVINFLTLAGNMI